MMASLQASGVLLDVCNIDIYSKPGQVKIIEGYRNSNAISILFVNLSEMRFLSYEVLQQLQNNSYLIAVWAWELPRPPLYTNLQFSRVDEIWVWSTYTQESFQTATDKPVVVIPTAIDIQSNLKWGRQHFGFSEDEFIFLFSFAATSCIARKNPFAVVEAFSKAFSAISGPKPTLVVKVNYLERIGPAITRDLRAALQLVNGILIDEHITRDEMYSVLNICDAYVSLHRSEGYGMGIAEAMYLGKPVIATAYSGNMEFMTSDNSYPVNYHLEKIKASDHFYDPWNASVFEIGQEWGEPEVEHAAQLMRYVYEHQTEAKAKGKAASESIRTHFSHQSVGARMVDRLLEIKRHRK